MESGIIVAIGLSLLIFIHEAGHFWMAKFFGMKIDEFGFGLPPRLWGKRVGETIYSLNWLPFGGFVKIYGEEGGENLMMSARGSALPHVVRDAGAVDPDFKRSFAAQAWWRRALVIVAGVMMNFLLGWILISAILMIGAPEGVYVTEVGDGSPAALSGFLPGDRLLDFNKSEEFIVFVKENSGRETIFNIARGKDEIQLTAVPRVNPPAGEGALGIALTEDGGQYGFFQSLWQGAKVTVYSVGAIFAALGMLLYGIFVGAPNLAGVVGPVGIFSVASDAGELGFVYLVQLVALISINLGAINLIPFPALDGGRLLFIFIEKLKGSPMSLRIERTANGIGFAFLLLLMLAITFRDLRVIFF